MTASFMPYYKKTKQLLWLCLSLALAATISTAHAAGSSLSVRNAELILEDDNYELNADVDVKFNAEIEQAISKGFELNFLIEFQLVAPRKYWFDDEIVTSTHRVTLSYHALSRQYLLLRDDAQGQPTQQKVFASLDEAKQALAEIRDLKVFHKSELEKAESYKAMLLMRLDYKKLSKTLQVDAIGSDGWKINSPRYEWVPGLSRADAK